MIEAFIIALAVCLAIYIHLIYKSDSDRRYENAQRRQEFEQRKFVLPQVALTIGAEFAPVFKLSQRLLPASIRSSLPFASRSQYENILLGDTAGIPYRLFDCTYQRGTYLYQQTILAYHVSQLKSSIPPFLIRPHKFTDGMKGFMGYDFVTLPELTPYGYTLLALEEQQEAVQRIMNIISIYKWPQLNLFADVTICNGEWLIFYKHNQLLEAERKSIERFLEIGSEIASAVLYANREHHHHW